MFIIKKSGILFLLIMLSYIGNGQHKNEVVFEVIISEIFADQTPTIGLPDAEFVELYNRSDNPVNLLNWTFSDATSTKTIETDFSLATGQYAILTKESNIDLFKTYGEVIGLSSFPSLNNSEDNLTLADADGNIIHQVNYLDDWHENSEKRMGGWSLEIIDPDNTCEGANNWTSSIDPTGGTPGKINSVDGDNVDTEAPLVSAVNIVNPNQIEVLFSESLPESELALINNYQLSDVNSIYSINSIENCESQPGICVIININESLAEGQPINLIVSGLSDCAGNQIVDEAFSFAIPATVNEQDVLINELLFAPPSGVEEFIELYNNSDKLIDLSVLMVADPTKSVNLSLTENFLLQPKALVALTKDKQALIEYYQPPIEANIVEVKDLPSLNNSDDLIMILNQNDTVIDEIFYFDDWHFELLDETKGTSLERIDINQPTNQADNWQSAALSVNSATPGYQNSEGFENAQVIPPGNLLINEILFDPPTEVSEFIELYNNSNSTINLANLVISNSNNPAIIRLAEALKLAPQEIVALTENKQTLIDYYQPPAEANIIEVEDLPSFTNSEDLISLLNLNSSIIDTLFYSDKWHFELLDVTKGISLERIDVNQPTSQASNWQSAAADNYATPGYRNSQALLDDNTVQTDMLITIENNTISPDNDGFEDFLIIQYQAPSTGWTGNLQIFDERGRFVAHPVKNQWLAENGLLKWDGLNENQERIPLGIYIVYAEFFNSEGKVEKQKLPIIVAGKL